MDPFLDDGHALPNDTDSAKASHGPMALSLIFGAVGLVGNSLVIYVMFSIKSMRSKPTGLLITSLAITDLLCSIFLILVTSTVDYFVRTTSSDPTSATSHVLCRLWRNYMPVWVCYAASVYNILLLAFDRYICVVHPIFHTNFVTNGRVVTVCVVTLFTCCLLETIFLLLNSSIKEDRCVLFSGVSSSAEKSLLWSTQFTLLFGLPSLCLLYFYIHMFIKIQQKVDVACNIADRRPSRGRPTSSSQTSRCKRLHSSQNAILKTLILIGVTFFTCSVSLMVYYLLHATDVISHPDPTVIYYMFCFMSLSCCSNPFIYAFSYPGFRNGVVKLTCFRLFPPKQPPPTNK